MILCTPPLGQSSLTGARGGKVLCQTPNLLAKCAWGEKKKMEFANPVKFGLTGLDHAGFVMADNAINSASQPSSSNQERSLCKSHYDSAR